MIATGGKPRYLDINNSNLAITSDDLFFSKSPGKTLVVGGGYVAIECAGFLSSLNFNTSLMTRSRFLRDFDSDVSDLIIDDLKNMNKVNILDYSLPVDIQKLENNHLLVKFQN